MGYQYEIHYKLGKDNVVADAFSRMPEEALDPIFATISFLTSPLFDTLKASYTEHPLGQRLITKLREDAAM